jgi:2-C-methyl-D-erythritol 4-phosphate cytidylyltransferase / 2-C-methyl-D-erythritol 2,4-cyclodiphosphate synthase
MQPNHVSAIIAAGGSGRRVGAPTPKQLLEIGGRTILQMSVEAFATHPRVTEVVVALPADLIGQPFPWLARAGTTRVITGGARRQDSVAAAFDAARTDADIVLVHDAARPFVSADLIDRCIDAAAAHGAAIAATPVSDTVKRVVRHASGYAIEGTIPRDSIFLAQTPQAFRRDVLGRAIALGREGAQATDEASLAELAGDRVSVVEGEADNVKITTAADLERARLRHAPARIDRVGTGYDLHRLVAGRALILGGISIPAEKGALGHSDADVICHAVTDATLGAACLGDIGRHFPDTDAQWKDASSIELLRQAVASIHRAGFQIVNVDVVVILERPKIAPHLLDIRGSLAAALAIEVEQVSVKGKTNEGVDAVGRGEAIAAHAVALLRQS